MILDGWGSRGATLATLTKRAHIDSSPQDTAKPSAQGVTLLVPAFNEENGIEGVVRRLAALDLGTRTEVLVVEDGSSDGTGAKLEQLQKEIPTLRVLKHGMNRGYGASLKTGFESACTDVVVITDADDTYPEDRIAELIARVDDGADMAIGARIGARVNIPLIRRPAKERKVSSKPALGSWLPMCCMTPMAAAPTYYYVMKLMPKVSGIFLM